MWGKGRLEVRGPRQPCTGIEYPGRFITRGLLEARADSYAIFWIWYTCLHMACMVRFVVGLTCSQDEVIGPTWGRVAVISR